MNTVDRNVFGSQEIAYECLADFERTDNFYKAINEVVGKGSKVIELGTGTGILSLMAAGAGASQVDAYEVTVEMANIARKNVEDNNLQSVIKVHEADVTTDELTKDKYDVLIAEMVTVGLIEEQLIPAFNHVLRQGLLNRNAVVVPGKQKTYAQLVDTDFNFFGFSLETIQIEQTWQKTQLKTEVSDKQLISEVDFNKAVVENKPIDSVVSKICDFTAKEDGHINAIRLMSDSVLLGSIVSGWTQCMNSPAIIPIEAFNVSKDECVRIEISYEMGGEMKTYQAKRL